MEKLTQDKCPPGQLVTADSITGQYKCDCNPETMKQNYWPADGKCYQHLTQGMSIKVENMINQYAFSFISEMGLFHKCTGPCSLSMLFRLDDQTSLPACLPPIVSSSSLRKKRNPFTEFSVLV